MKKNYNINDSCYIVSKHQEPLKAMIIDKTSAVYFVQYKDGKDLIRAEKAPHEIYHSKAAAQKEAHLYGLGMPYIPATDEGTSLNVDVPDSMGFETHTALKKIKELVGGSMSNFVRDRLGYNSIKELTDALAPEQIDAVAVAIYNIEAKNQGVIIGDQTGIGKGRQAAAIIRYAIKRGLQPIFLTEKPSLFSDIYRDLEAIGTSHAVPFIVNGRESKTQIKDSNGEVVYEALEPVKQKAIFESQKVPKEYDWVCCTYTQFNQAEKKPIKPLFLSAIAEDNIIIMDESHNASGNSNTGLFLRSVLSKSLGVVFLSATFAKRSDNMPIYASKTCISEANMSSEELSEAIEKGGVALQEILASQLVAEGQMLRRERTFEGIEVNYINLDKEGAAKYGVQDLENEHRLMADNVFDIIRDIIKFQEDYVMAGVKQLDNIAKAEQAEVELRKGTEKAGVDAPPFVSKIFNIIDQILFAIKAEATADRAIQRLKEGKKVVIGFSKTMGSFVENLITEEGVIADNNALVIADFKIVLDKALRGILRYSEKDATGKSTPKYFTVASLGPDAEKEYARISHKIADISTGICISPLDVIIQKIQAAGFKVAEVTGRKYMLQLGNENLNGFGKTRSEIENAPWYKKYVDTVRNYVNNGFKADRTESAKMDYPEANLYPLNPEYPIIMPLSVVKKGMGKNSNKQDEAHELTLPNFEDLPKYIHNPIAIIGSKRNDEAVVVITEIRNNNGDYTMAAIYFNSSFQNIKANVIASVYNKPNDDYVKLLNNAVRENKFLSVDESKIKKWFKNTGKLRLLPVILNHASKINNKSDLGKFVPNKANSKTLTGIILSRKRENTNDAFRRFQNNEVDVLMINQSGSTGASAHALPTAKVDKSNVKQRVMIITQAELNINTEVQKRGRVNRTGQIIKPIYDYISSAIPAEKRLMMMLKKKLKSLDANTTSNQKNSNDLLDIDIDFLNKYGDALVIDYLIENPEINDLLGDPLNLNDSEKSDSEAKENAASKVSGRVAILPTKLQQAFYDEMGSRYAKQVQYLKSIDEYDLEVQTMNLEAKTLDKKMVIDGKGGTSSFGLPSIMEKCEVNVLRKPFTKEELKDKLSATLQGRQPHTLTNELIETHANFTNAKIIRESKEIEADYQRKIKNIPNEPAVKKAEGSPMYNMVLEQRKQELSKAMIEKIEANQTSIKNEAASLRRIFQFFEVKKGLLYRQIVYEGKIDLVPSICLGFDINMKAKNPFAPSAITLMIAISNSVKYLPVPLSKREILDAFIVESSRLPNNIGAEYIDNWTQLCKQSNVSRKIRYIVTGNILQAFKTYKGNLISYTTIDGKEKKGILQADNFDPVKASGGMVNVPIFKALQLFKNLPNEAEIFTSDMKISFRKVNGNYLVFAPSGRAKWGWFFLDPDLLALVQNNNFTLVSGIMKTIVDTQNIEAFIKVLQTKFNTTVRVSDAQYASIADVELAVKQETKIILPKNAPEPVKAQNNELKLKALAMELELELMEF